MENQSKRPIIVCNNKYALSNITEEDREQYVELQRQINGDNTFFLNPISKDTMWESVLENKWEFAILDEHMKFCGTICLKDETSTPEIGISILEEFRNRGIAQHAVNLLIDLTYKPQIIDYYIVRIEVDNLHSRHVFEKMGAELIGEDLSTLERFQKYLNDNNWSEKHFEELSCIYAQMEGNARVVKYKLVPQI